MKQYFLLFLFCCSLTCLQAQSLIHIDELNKVQNPYSSVLPITFHYSFSLESKVVREEEYKPTYELYEYFNTSSQAWQPSFKFEYDYLNTGKLNIKNEYSYDLLAMDWINSKRMTFTYDAFGFQSQAIEETYDISNGGLTNYALYEQQHEPTGSLLQEKISYWSLSLAGWLTDHKHDYTYNSDHRETSIIHSNWEALSSQWSPYEEYFSNYDGNGNLISYLGRTWNPDSAKWLNLTMDTMIYDASNHRIHDETMLWSLSSNLWEPFFGNDYEYDATGNITRITSMLWESASQQFQNTSQYLYEFNSGLLVSTIFQTWNASLTDWTNFIKTEFIYDANNFLAQKIIYNWDGSNWATSYQYTYTNDLNGNLLQSVGQTWNTGNSIWVNVERYTAEWISFITTIEENKLSPGISIYPNPASDIVFLSGFENQNGYFLEIVDPTGEIQMSFAKLSDAPILLTGLTNGIYVLKVKDPNHLLIATRKLVVAK